jgi:DNA-binding transcriptional MocR family regulator
VDFAEGWGRVTGALVADCSPATLRVAGALAIYANSTGQCWPGLRRIAEDLDCSIRSVQAHIDQLIAAGWVSVVEHTAGKRRVLELAWLSTGARVSRAPDQPKRAGEPRGARGSPARGARLTRAELDQELDQELELDETAPTPEGWAILAEIRAVLAARGQPVTARQLVPPGELLADPGVDAGVVV